MNTLNRFKYHRNPVIDGIEICEARRSLHSFPNHSHEEIYAFSLMEEGGSYWNGKAEDEFLVRPSDIAVINPGQIHSGVPMRDKFSTYRMIYIDVSLMKDISSDIREDYGGLPEFEQVVLSNPDLSGLYRRLYNSLSRDSEHIEIESELISFVGNLIASQTFPSQLAGARAGENQVVKRAAEFLAADLSEKITLEEAAGEAGLSRYYFIRIFKREMGVSPHVFRTQKRIDEARKLILAGMSFSEVALETGFTDQSHLTNQFRLYTGATPRQYLSG